MKLKIIFMTGFAFIFMKCSPQLNSSNPFDNHGTNGFKKNGQERCNGIDYYDESTSSAWFLGKEKIIQYCIYRMANFEKSELDLEQTIQESFLKWSQYIKNKKIGTSSQTFPGFSITAHNQGACNGHEDIKFFFGVPSSDPMVKDYLIQFNEPIAAAIRTSYNQNDKWGKGIVWISPSGAIADRDRNLNKNYLNPHEQKFPDWNLSHTVEGVLLHELGHIYGNSHVSATIMDEKLHSILRDSRENMRKYQLTHIDNFRELYVCSDCPISLTGRLGIKLIVTDANGTTTIDKQPETFKFLTGRNPEGEISSSISGSPSDKLVLQISDSIDSYSFELFKGAESLESIFHGARIFFGSWSFFNDLGGGSYIFSIYNSGAISYKKLTTSDNKEVVVTVERNMFTPLENNLTASTFVMKYLFQGETKILFLGDTVPIISLKPENPSIRESTSATQPLVEMNRN